MRPSQRRIAETRIRGSVIAQLAEEPNPRAPRSLAASSSASTTRTERDGRDDELRDAHAWLDGELRLAVRVQEHDADLSAVAGVDQAR